MDILLLIIIASLSLSAVSLIGGSLLIWEKILTQKRATYFVGFAAGVMLTTAFLNLIPEALHETDDPTIYAFGLAGVIVFFLIERFVLWFHHHDAIHTKPSSYLILLGDGLHNFFDGLAIAAAFLTNQNLGLFTTLAIASHEIPQEIADFTILIHGGMKKTKALFYNFLSALAALAGGLLGFYYLKSFEEFVPLLVMFSAGVFIYIACSDLIPDLHQDFKKQKKWITTIPFLLGVFVSFILITTFGEH